MKIEILPPLIITPRLMPGAQVAEGSFVSIGYSELPGDSGRTRFRYCIDTPSGEYEADDLQSGCYGGSLQEGLETLLSFLLSAAEGYGYRLAHPERSADDEPFPEWVAEWAHLHSDELESLWMDLEDNPNLIRER